MNKNLATLSFWSNQGHCETWKVAGNEERDERQRAKKQAELCDARKTIA
jgi:hypothetical protein